MGKHDEKEDEGKFFVVDKILDHRKNSNNNFEYLVKWKNFSDKDNTWEPIENFAERDLVNKYWQRIENG